MDKAVAARIRERLDALGLTGRAASLSVSTNPDLIRGVLRSDKAANPTFETLTLIAKALQVSVEWLTTGEGGVVPEEIARETARERPAQANEPQPLKLNNRDVPVMGTAAGSTLANGMQGFEFLGEAVEYVFRPPALIGVKDLYALYITGDSMDPLVRPGDLKFVHPGKPPRPGDLVIVKSQRHANDPGQSYVKILERRTAERIVLRQLNPDVNLEIPARDVAFIHRVLTTNELFGV